jgi:hypothetical protein
MILVEDAAKAQALIGQGIKPETLAISRLANTRRDTPPMSLEFWAGFKDCNCNACLGLKAECGSHYAWLSRKLLQKGWAGVTSPAEKAYRRAHSPAKAPPTEAQMAVRAKFASGYIKNRKASGVR